MTSVAQSGEGSGGESRKLVQVCPSSPVNRRPMRLLLSVDTDDHTTGTTGPISPSVASMMKGRTAPLTPQSPANRRTSVMLGLKIPGSSTTPTNGEGESSGDGGGGTEEWKLDTMEAPRSPLFLRRLSKGQPRSPSFNVAIPASTTQHPCCPSPLVQEERSVTAKASVHHDEAARTLDQNVRPGMQRKKSFLATGIVPGPY